MKHTTAWMQEVEQCLEQLSRDADDYMDVVGTIPRMESIESSLEQRPRATQEAKVENTED